MKDYLKIPKVQLSITLIVIFACALIVNFSINKLIVAAVVMITTMAFDLLFVKIRRKEFFIPSAAVTTSLIIILLSDPSLPIYIPILAGGFAMASKNFIRPARHIFNPAAFGLAAASLIFQVPLSWWGPSSLFPSTIKMLPFFILLFSPALVSALRMKRYFIMISFFLVYVIGAAILQGNFQPATLFRLIVDPTVIFFVLVMAPEPMTTPSTRNNQLLFGTFVAIITLISSRILSQLPLLSSVDTLILSLLIGNLVFFKKR